MMTERPRTAGGHRRGRPPAAPPPVLLPAVLSCRVCHALFVPHHTGGPTAAAGAATAATGVAAAPLPRAGAPDSGPVPSGVAAGPVPPGTAADRYCSKACRRVGSRRER